MAGWFLRVVDSYGLWKMRCGGGDGDGGVHDVFVFVRSGSVSAFFFFSRLVLGAVYLPFALPTCCSLNLPGQTGC
jgi:hypothetical protein